MFPYLRNLIQEYNVCYSHGLLVFDNIVSFRKNRLPGQFSLKECLLRPLTIVTISYFGNRFKDYLDLLLINSTTQEIQRLNSKIDNDNSLDFSIINFLNSQGLHNFIYYAPNGMKILFYNNKMTIEPYYALNISTYCSSIKNCEYFVLLYLETRLMNPNLTISEINNLIQNSVTPDYFNEYKEKVDSIVNPVSQRNREEIASSIARDVLLASEKHDILNYPPQPKFPIISNELTPKRGLVLCKGHRHSPLSEELPSWLPQDIIWTYMDIDPETQPDIIGDISSYESYEKAGFSRYDYVLTSACPRYITDILRGSRMVLKPGGKLIYPGIINALRYQITKNPKDKEFFTENPESGNKYVSEILDNLWKSEQYSALTIIDHTAVLTV